MTRALLVATLAVAALAAPAPRDPGYNVGAPRNAVSLHGQARGRQQIPFSIQLKPESHERPVVPLRYSLPNAGLAKDVDSRESLESLEINVACPKGQLRHGHRCVVPKVNRNIFVFGRGDDSKEAKSVDYANVPLPELEYNIIFVRPSSARKPVVVPPPQKKTVVYVLEDEPSLSDEILESPSYPEVDPEVYYVKVKPGENPQLPGGIDLHTAYNQALQDQDLGGLGDNIELSLGSHQGLGAAAGARGAGAGALRALAGGVSLEEIAEQVANAGGAGVPLPGIGAGFGGVGREPSAPAPSFNLGNLNDIGVPLPSLGLGRQADQGQGQGQQSALGQQGLAANLANSEALIRLMRDSLAAQGLELDIDNGVAKIGARSAEVVNPAKRYLLPN